MALLILKLLGNYWKGTYVKGIMGVATIYVRMRVRPEIQKTIFKSNVFLSSYRNTSAGADLGEECRGCAPLPEMTYGFLIQLVFCKKVWFIGVSYAIP